MTGEKTASYYTPESLTKCVVKYALKELDPRRHAGPANTRPDDLRAGDGFRRVS